MAQNHRSWSRLGGLAVLASAALAFAPAAPRPAVAAEKDLVDTAVAAGSFKTLVTAVQAAGLVDTLKGAGPFTIFAPTDEAFAKLPAGALDGLLKDKEKLKAVLTYHVVAGKHLAADVAKQPFLASVQGASLLVAANEGVKVGGAAVKQADLVASNGVIHVVDSVLLPPDVVDLAVGAHFTTLVKAVQAAGLVETLKGKGPFTIFAPTDAAFAKLPAGTLDALLKDKAKLTAILTYHVVAGSVRAADVVKLKSAKTLNGQDVAIDASKGVQVGGANVVLADLVGTNGIVHVIDTVLLPK